MGRRIDLTGKRFGKLGVVRYFGSDNGAVWECRCDCGNVTTVKTSHLRAGTTNSCGCVRGESHGLTKRGQIAPEYSVWRSMKMRCTNPNTKGYHNYGGRGIWVCDRWLKSFKAFLRDVGRRPGDHYSLDRIDNDGGYEPDNVRWATTKRQRRNTRINIYLTHQGRTMVLMDWAIELGIPYETIRYRYHSGMSVEEVLSTKTVSRKLAPVQIDYIRERYRAGEAVKDLAAEYGVSEVTIYRRLGD